MSPSMLWAPQEPRVGASPTWYRQEVRTKAMGDHQLFPGCEAGMKAGLTLRASPVLRKILGKQPGPGQAVWSLRA